MNPVYALFADGFAADRAVVGLRAAGVPDADITVITDEPMEDRAFHALHGPTRLWWLAGAGGAAGCALATWLTRATELAWPIPTGNMSITAWWPNMIVMFEMTMLGAVVATVAGFVLSSGLGRPRPALYDQAVTDGQILVGVEHPSERTIADVRRALGPACQEAPVHS